MAVERFIDEETINRLKNLDCDLFRKQEVRSRVFSLLFEYSIRFLSALQQNRSQVRLLYLFYNKEILDFLTHSANIFAKSLSGVSRASVL